MGCLRTYQLWQGGGGKLAKKCQTHRNVKKKAIYFVCIMYFVCTTVFKLQTYFNMELII